MFHKIQNYRTPINSIPMKNVTLFLLASLLAICTFAQDVQDTGLRSHATLFGIGATNRLDTYLSPLEYTGVELRMAREHQRQTRMMNGRVSMQNMLQGSFAPCESPTEDGTALCGMADWDFAWHYHWKLNERLTVMAGPGTGVHGGFFYNTRNGNNPAEALLSWDVSASGIIEYAIPMKRRPITLRYQANIPLAGVMFSPNYGQSYYEIFSLGNSDHNICFTHPFQAFSVDQFLTADIPVGSHTLRAGYLCSIRQSHVNSIKRHTWSNLFMIGYVKYFQLVKK